MPMNQAGVSGYPGMVAPAAASAAPTQQGVGSLEARAAALSAHAAEVRAAARRAKAAAAAARRHNSDHDDIQPIQTVEYDKMGAESVNMNMALSRTTPDDRTTLMLRNLPNNYT